MQNSCNLLILNDTC